MNEKVDLQKVAQEISATILGFPIDVQNELFGAVRNILISERKAHIERELNSISEHKDRTDYAQKTLETILMAQVSFPTCEPKKGY